MTFQDLNLNKPLLNALADMEFEYPTPIQKEAFSVIMSGKDVMGVAQTGTGKTVAYLLPLLRMMKFSNQVPPRILIIVPTRELVVQQVAEAEKLTKYLNFRVGGAYGGTNINNQKRLLMAGLDLLIATPGRLLDLSLHGVLKLQSIKHFVIDEVDEMMDLGFRPQLLRIFALLPKRRQNLMFSATLPEPVENLIVEHFEFAKKIEIAPHGTPLERIAQKAYHVPNFFTKVNLLKHLLLEDEEMKKVLVFVATKKLADIFYGQMTENGGDAANEIAVIHSNKSQNYRLNAVTNFHEGKCRVLIATDIMARGLDIVDVTHVVNFDFPDESANYLHRIGRTGRADADGVAISFITNDEEPFQMEVEALMKMSIPLLDIPEEVEISKQLIPMEIERSAGDKNYLSEPNLGKSRGAFQEKKLKNQKVNRAQEKRKARIEEKKNSSRRGMKPTKRDKKRK